MAKDMVATAEQERSDTSSKNRNGKLPGITPPPSPSPPPQKTAPPRGKSKQTTKQAAIVTSNATAKSLFTETDRIRKLQAEITTLQKQLESKNK